MTPEMFDAVWRVAAVVFGAGAFWSELRAIRKDIARLEAKQDKYNHLQERTISNEASAKSAHHRIDALENHIYENYH